MNNFDQIPVNFILSSDIRNLSCFNGYNFLNVVLMEKKGTLRTTDCTVKNFALSDSAD